MRMSVGMFKWIHREGWNVYLNGQARDCKDCKVNISRGDKTFNDITGGPYCLACAKHRMPAGPMKRWPDKVNPSP